MVPVENHDNMLPRGGTNSLTVLIDYAIIIASFNTGVPLRRVDTDISPHAQDIPSLHSSHRLTN